MRLRLFGLCAGLVLFGAAQASAYPIVGDFDDLRIGDVVLVTAVQGGYRVQEQPGTGPAQPGGDPLADFLTFCIEPNEPIGDGVLFVVTGFGLDISFRTAAIYNRFREGGFDPGYPPLPPGSFPPAENFDIPIGLQTGIWFTEGEGGGIDNAYAKCGRGVDTPGVGGITGCIDGNLLGLGGVRSLELAFADTGQRAQRLLTRVKDNPDDPCQQVPRPPECDFPNVPEPGSMILLGSGLMGLAAAVRRRRIRRD